MYITHHNWRKPHTANNTIAMACFEVTHRVSSNWSVLYWLADTSCTVIGSYINAITAKKWEVHWNECFKSLWLNRMCARGLKSPASLQFVQHLIQPNNKDDIKVLHNWLLPMDSPHKESLMRKAFSCHDATNPIVHSPLQKAEIKMALVTSNGHAFHLVEKIFFLLGFPF